MLDMDLAIVEPNRLLRSGLTRLLDDGTVHVVSGERLADLQGWKRRLDVPTVALVDVDAGGVSLGVSQIVGYLERIAEGCETVFFASDFNITVLEECFAVGGAGLLMKTISPEALKESLQLVAAGEKVFPSQLATVLGGLSARQAEADLDSERLRGDHHFSDREIDILRCLINGDPNKVIALNLGMAESTVKVHLKNILRKTHAANRTQAAIWALENGLVMQAVTPALQRTCPAE